MSNTKNKPQVVQPTSAGSNLPAQDSSESVGNITLDTEDVSVLDNTTQDKPGPQLVQDHSVEVANDDVCDMNTFGRTLALASLDKRPITDLKKMVTEMIPKDKESALTYLKAIQRMQGIMDVLSSEVYEAVHVRFGT